jgi:hypothetical protein
MKYVAYTFLVLLILYLIYDIYFGSSSTNPHIVRIKENFTRIDPSYKDIRIVEGRSGGGTYTLNKRKIVMCITDPKTGKPYPENVQMYVALHELAHVISKTYGHNAEFDRNFKDLLLKAQRAGVYTPISRAPPTYCL